jgi:hypothetical protein
MALLEKPFEKVRPKMVAARLELMSQLAKFGPGEIRSLPRPGEWSALEIAHHVYITDGLSLDLMYQVQNEENPLIHALEDEAPRLTHESEPPVSLDAVLGGMAARREEIFEYLNALPSTAWERPFRHPQWGQLKFYQLINILPQHDRQHAQQLAALKGAITPVQL